MIAVRTNHYARLFFRVAHEKGKIHSMNILGACLLNLYGDQPEEHRTLGGHIFLSCPVCIILQAIIPCYG